MNNYFQDKAKSLINKLNTSETLLDEEVFIMVEEALREVAKDQRFKSHDDLEKLVNIDGTLNWENARISIYNNDL